MALFKFYKNIVLTNGDAGSSESDMVYIRSSMAEIHNYIMKYHQTTKSEKESFKFSMKSDLYLSDDNLADLFEVSLRQYKTILFRTKYNGDFKPAVEFIIGRENYNVKDYAQLVEKVNAYFGLLVDANQLKVFNKGSDIICFTIVFSEKCR